MRKTLVALVAAVPLIVASPALAAPPEFLPVAPTEVLPLCGTSGIQIEQVGKSQREHKNGKSTGSLRFRLTNVETGASVLVNASGPGRFMMQEQPDGTGSFTFSATGQNLIYPLSQLEEELLVAQGLPRLFVSSGPVAFSGTFVLATGEPLSFDVTRVPPRVRDLCAQLT